MFRQWHYLRLLATFVFLLALDIRKPSQSFPFFDGDHIEGVPRWALNWASAPQAPCRRNPSDSRSALKTASTARDDKALAARAERFAKEGLQCLAAEDLLHLAEDFEKTNTRAARDALS